jgi:hypothetical protein
MREKRKSLDLYLNIVAVDLVDQAVILNVRYSAHHGLG